MIPTNPAETQAGGGQMASTTQADTALKTPVSFGEGFLRVFVVGLGIIIGGFIALIVGLVTGWIPFNC